MQAIIMAGGKRHLNEALYKYFTKTVTSYWNKLILELNIKQLSDAGIDNIIIAVGIWGN